MFSEKFGSKKCVRVAARVTRELVVGLATSRVGGHVAKKQIVEQIRWNDSAT